MPIPNAYFSNFCIKSFEATVFGILGLFFNDLTLYSTFFPIENNVGRVFSFTFLFTLNLSGDELVDFITLFSLFTLISKSLIFFNR